MNSLSVSRRQDGDRFPKVLVITGPRSCFMFTAFTFKIEVLIISFKSATIKVLNGQVHWRAMTHTAPYADVLRVGEVSVTKLCEHLGWRQVRTRSNIH